LSGNSYAIELLPRTQVRVEVGDTFSADPPRDDSLEEISQILFARITEAVISHETNDWPGYYDKLCAVVCRVVAQSTLSSDAKSMLTRRLIVHIVEVEKWWPRPRPKEEAPTGVACAGAATSASPGKSGECSGRMPEARKHPEIREQRAMISNRGSPQRSLKS
jgi:hypothetical protein